MRTLPAVSSRPKRRAFVTLLAALISLAPCLELSAADVPTTIHAIIVADTSQTLKRVQKGKTQDMTFASLTDVNNWKTHFRNIKSYTKSVVNAVVLDDQYRTPSQIVQACEALAVKPNDVVIFYYSGHGYRTKETRDRWPAVDVWDYASSYQGQAMAAKPITKLHQPAYEVGMNLTDIYRALSAKKPRLLLVLADCCNELGEFQDIIPPTFPWSDFVDANKTNVPPLPGPLDIQATSVTQGDAMAQQYRALYLNSKGSYLASGSIPPGFSYSDPKPGGFFTYAFLAEFEGAPSGSGWDDLFKKISSSDLCKGHEGFETVHQKAQFAKNPAIRPAS